MPNPGCSFYSTTADLSTTKGSEEPSLALAMRPKYVALSSLIPVTADEGAAMNSAPKSQLLSWTGSDVRRRTAKRRLWTQLSPRTSTAKAKPDNIEPESPSYTQLATPIAGD
ncbi:hypothetical protein CSKR_200314 [Clonorchis sinensis]|uniref:Uncharacterized protein n=1 Tax=Clonorchis sinensis TaxID=79923 RepID=A0A8T1LZD1_CLOSI|nr:hypothetical protein CSKR_200314 [Clonorchis sinensis]